MRIEREQLEKRAEVGYGQVSQHGKSLDPTNKQFPGKGLGHLIAVNQCSAIADRKTGAGNYEDEFFFSKTGLKGFMGCLQDFIAPRVTCRIKADGSQRLVQVSQNGTQAADRFGPGVDQL
jgi:hypothetical protein